MNRLDRFGNRFHNGRRAKRKDRFDREEYLFAIGERKTTSLHSMVAVLVGRRRKVFLHVVGSSGGHSWRNGEGHSICDQRMGNGALPTPTSSHLDETVNDGPIRPSIVDNLLLLRSTSERFIQRFSLRRRILGCARCIPTPDLQ